MMEQLAKSRASILIVFVGAIIIVCGVIISERILNLRLDYMINSPIEIANLPFYAGVLSTFGKMLWFGAIAVCSLGIFLLNEKGSRFVYLISSTLLTAWFVADDLLMLHEGFDHFLHVPEVVSYIAYMLIIGVYLSIFLALILRETSYPLLALSFFFLGASVLMGLSGTSDPLIILTKGSLKFIGIAFWTAYFFSTVIGFVKNTMKSRNLINRLSN